MINISDEKNNDNEKVIEDSWIKTGAWSTLIESPFRATNTEQGTLIITANGDTYELVKGKSAKKTPPVFESLEEKTIPVIFIYDKDVNVRWVVTLTEDLTKSFVVNRSIKFKDGGVSETVLPANVLNAINALLEKKSK